MDRAPRFRADRAGRRRRAAGASALAQGGGGIMFAWACYRLAFLMGVTGRASMSSKAKLSLTATAAVLAFGIGGSGISGSAMAQQANMTFFVTSVGSGNGANVGGLAGADAHCQQLAASAGAGG